MTIPGKNGWTSGEARCGTDLRRSAPSNDRRSAQRRSTWSASARIRKRTPGHSRGSITRYSGSCLDGCRIAIISGARMAIRGVSGGPEECGKNVVFCGTTLYHIIPHKKRRMWCPKNHAVEPQTGVYTTFTTIFTYKLV